MLISKRSCVLLLLVVIATGGCGGGTSENLPTANITADSSGSSESGDAAINEVSTVPSIGGAESSEPVVPVVELFPEVTIETTLGNIRVRLNSEKAPETVDNFLYNYVDRSFFDGTVFHFVQDGFIAIAGGYDADLKEKAARPPIRNEAGNGLKNVRGTIAMSRQPDYKDSATSQFYFNLVDNPTLDQTDMESSETFGYCVFGEVIEGVDVLEKIAEVEVRTASDFPNVPIEPIVIKSVRRNK